MNDILSYPTFPEKNPNPAHIRIEPSGPIVLKTKSNQAIEILFLGDTHFGESYQEYIQQNGGENILEKKGYDFPLEKVKSVLANAHLAIANLETPLTHLKQSPLAGKKRYLHWSHPTQAPQHLLSHNISIVNLANNHMLDYGEVGLQDTLHALQAHNIRYFGAGNTIDEASAPCLIHLTDGENDFHIAVIGAFEENEYYRDNYHFYANHNTSGVHRLNVDSIAKNIATLKQRYPNLLVILFPHWGNNYNWKTKKQSETAKRLFDAGVHLIIGHGAHMLQEIDNFNGHWVIHGIGNFMFNSQGQYTRMNAPPYGFITKLVCTLQNKTLAIKVRLYPIVTDNKKTQFQTRLVTDIEFNEVCALLEEIPNNPLEHLKRDSDSTGNFIELPLYPVHASHHTQTRQSPSPSPTPRQKTSTQPASSKAPAKPVTPPNTSTSDHKAPMIELKSSKSKDSPRRLVGVLCNIQMDQDLHNPSIPWVVRTWLMHTFFKQEGIDIFVYAPQSVDIHVQKAAGYLIENGQYVLRLLDIPTINYDGSTENEGSNHLASLQEFHAWAQAHNIAIYPSPSITAFVHDKYKTYQMIQEIDKTLEPYSEIFNAKQKQLDHFFEKNALVVLKPRYGHSENGIILIEKNRDNNGTPYYLLNQYWGDERREMMLTNHQETLEKVQSIIQKTEYMIQQGITSLRYHGSAFHIRVIMIQNTQWQWVHEIRCGTHYSALSTYPFLGKSYPLVDFLARYFDKPALDAFIDKLQRTSLNLIQRLENLFPEKIGELAFDFIVDQHHHFHLINLNTKPEIVGDPQQATHFFEAKHHPKQTELYLQHLARFFKWQHS